MIPNYATLHFYGQNVEKTSLKLGITWNISYPPDAGSQITVLMLQAAAKIRGDGGAS